jgi:hypothetical protein
MDTISRGEHTRISGIETIEISAGKKLKIETSPNGVEVFKQTVPDGKKWTAILIVDIVEEDA